MWGIVTKPFPNGYKNSDALQVQLCCQKARKLRSSVTNSSSGLIFVKNPGLFNQAQNPQRCTRTDTKYKFLQAFTQGLKITSFWIIFSIFLNWILNWIFVTIYWMNILLNEYFRLKFWMNIELNRFWARFNVWMNFQNVSHRASRKPYFFSKYFSFL